jgi:tetratricopeptide (TPR) repeat protein
VSASLSTIAQPERQAFSNFVHCRPENGRPGYKGNRMSANPHALIAEGYRARQEQRPQEARQCFADAVELCRHGHDRVLLAEAFAGLGQTERDLGNIEAALPHYEAAVSLIRSLDDPLWLAHTLRHVGDILQDQGLYTAASPYHEEALALYRADDEAGLLDVANAARGFGTLNESIGRQSEATALFEEARALYVSADVGAGVEECERRFAGLAGRSRGSLND